jgi:hypothetical protein
MKILSLLILLTLLLFGFSCKKKKTNEEEAVNFKKGEMLVHTANKIVLPGLLNLKNSVNELNSSWNQLKQIKMMFRFWKFNPNGNLQF